MEHVILVDEKDLAVGTMEKMEAHRKGELHRAFSVVVYNSKGEILLQKRAKTKYHSGGLWTNACCSHPQPNESMAEATARKLKQEMGIGLHLDFAFKFIYQIKLDRNLVEHEYDHVFTGLFDGEPVVNAEEVEDWRFVNLASLRKDVAQNPDSYTYWFPIIINHPELVIGDR
jgi:isopentenyl-diphosphate delta-isomerase